MQPLHALNPARIGIIRDWAGPLKNQRILDVGCGGGLVCEPLARLGARMTGIDAGAENVAAAQAHAQESGLKIDYHCTTAERFKGSFDTVLALEIIEHVDHPQLFIDSLLALTRPGGSIILSTLNRTAKSLALGKIAAEYVLGWVPRGTHDWRKFKKPSEIAAMMGARAKIADITGLVYDLRRGEFVPDARDVAVNYFIHARKH